MMKIPQDIPDLELMMADQMSVPPQYLPGPYWEKKSQRAAKDIIKYGLDNFRGPDSEIATSFADSHLIDRRFTYNTGVRKLLAKILGIYPLSSIFNSQVALTRHYFDKSVLARSMFANHSEEIAHLLANFSIPEHSNKFGSEDFSQINGKNISNHYLDLLHQHKLLSEHIDFTQANSFFEIGAGFGVNIHLLIENYPNIKKFIYLDIPPNLHVGIQYLKSFYGASVHNYSVNRKNKSIAFNSSDELEIICITPPQIEDLDVEIDIFQNAHSFLEMTEDIVSNYATHIQKILSQNSSIALVSYENFSDSTLRATSLPEFFNRKFIHFKEPHLWVPDEDYYFFIS